MEREEREVRREELPEVSSKSRSKEQEVTSVGSEKETIAVTNREADN